MGPTAAVVVVEAGKVLAAVVQNGSAVEQSDPCAEAFFTIIVKIKMDNSIIFLIVFIFIG